MKIRSSVIYLPKVKASSGEIDEALGESNRPKYGEPPTTGRITPLSPPHTMLSTTSPKKQLPRNNTTEARCIKPTKKQKNTTMNKHLITQAILLTGISLSTTACVSPRQTATAGASVGRVIAVPLGFTAALLFETGHQSGDIVAANPRYDTKNNSVSKTGEQK